MRLTHVTLTGFSGGDAEIHWHALVKCTRLLFVARAIYSEPTLL